MSNSFRKMRSIPDKKLNEALGNHRDHIAFLVRSALAQNRWNVGMVLMILISYAWMGALTFAPDHVKEVPAAGLFLFVVILVSKKVGTYRLRRRLRQAEAAMGGTQQ